MLIVLLASVALAGDVPVVDPHSPGWHCYVTDKIADGGLVHKAPDIQAAATWRDSWKLTEFLNEVAPDTPGGTLLQMPADNGAPMLCSKIAGGPAPTAMTVLPVSGELRSDRLTCTVAKELLAGKRENEIQAMARTYGASTSDAACFQGLGMSDATWAVVSNALK